MRVQQTVRGDDDVDLALLEALEHRLGFLGIAKARQALHPHRPLGKAIAEVGQMLLHQQRRRRQHRHLLARLRGDEGGAHGDLGLAKADIAADDAVHRARTGQILEHLADRLRLILGLLERKGVEKLW